MESIASQNSDVAIFGNVVIRRPRNVEAIAGVRREVSVLPRLRNLLVLPIPVMQIVEIEDETLTIHSLIPGKPLLSVRNLNDLTVEHLAHQIGRFLKSLHEIDPLEFRDLKLPNIDQNWWIDFLNKAEQLVFPKLAYTISLALRSQIQSHIDRLPSLPCMLTHGDFGSSNILWDGDRNITGIIDFATLGWGDPGWDIAGLFVSYGSSFIEQLAFTYPAVKSFEKRSLFYQRMFALMDAVFGAEHLDDKTLNCGLDTLKLVV
jgi:aminoglycoside 2''-phosphotransferase